MAISTRKEGSWQAEKSEKTRTAVMEATIQCFIDLGYTNTTVTKIADTAGVSRGAMMHHFDSRFDIIKASVHYLTDKRLAEFRKLITEAQGDTGGNEVNEENLHTTVNAMWKFFHLPSYTAFQELLIAARSDSELSKVMTPAQKEFDSRITNSIRALFPAWENLKPTQEVLTDLFFYTLQGMAISKITNKKQTRVKNLLDLLVQQALYEYKQASSKA
jgi:AcrR family transcriptional regulator